MPSPLPVSIDWFRGWQEPDAFLSSANRSMDELDQREWLSDGQHELFLQNRWKHLHEAWAAGMFATILQTRNLVRVRLGEGGRRPDFYIQHKGKLLDFELTECDRPRRRGREYQLVREGKRPCTTVHDPAKDAHHLRRRLPLRIKEKVAKHYDPKRHLLVYINLGLDPSGKPTVPDHELQDLTRHGRDEFLSTWLLWGHLAIQVWPRWRWLRLDVKGATSLISGR